MKRGIARWVSVLLSVIMVIGLLPVSALADYTNDLTIISPEYSTTYVTAQTNEAVTFEVEATANDPSLIQYKWKRMDADGSWVDIPGATAPSYTTPGSSGMADAGEYQCYITDGAAQLHRYFTLDVRNIEYVDWNSPTIHPGENATLYVDVAAADFSQVRYQWTVMVPTGEEGCYTYEEIEGATGATYTTPLITECSEETCSYRCEIYDDCAYAEQPYCADFYVNLDNEFRLQAKNNISNVAVRPNEAVTLEAVASGYDLDGMTWNGWFEVDTSDYWNQEYTEIPDTASNTLTLDSVTANATYACRAGDRFGNTAECWIYVYVDNNLRVSPVGGYDCYVSYGGDAVLQANVSAYDMTGMTCQWAVEQKYVDDDGYIHYENVDIEGATGTTLTVENVTEAANYVIQVTDRYGNYNSAWFNVGVDNGLTVEAVGADRISVAPGSSVTLQARISADNMTGLTVEWQRDGETVEGTIANGVSTFTIENVESRTWVYCMVSDCYGNWTQIGFIVSVDTGLTADFGQTGDAVTVSCGGSVTLTPVISANQGVDYSIYWYVWDAQGYDIELADREAASQTFTNVTRHINAECDVYDDYGNYIELHYAIDVENGLTASAVGPTDITVPEGGSARMAVTASATNGELAYQWYIVREEQWEEPRNLELPDEEFHHVWYEEIEGANKSDYTLRNVTEDTVVVCVVTDCYGGEAEVRFTVRLYSGPVIVHQPVDFYGALDSTATFTVEASGDGLTYQWYIRNPGEAAFQLSTKTTSVYSTPIRAASDGRELYCVITDANGASVQTRTVTMSTATPVLRFRDVQYQTDNDGRFLEDENGNYIPVLDGNGNVVYLPDDYTELRLEAGSGWVAEIWYGDRRLTGDDLEDLFAVDGGQEILSLEYIGDGEFLVRASDWLENPGLLVYGNTNLEQGNAICITTELPRIGAYYIPEADREAFIGRNNPLVLNSDGDFFFIVSNDEDLTILDVALDDWTNGAWSAEPQLDQNDEEIDNVWFVGLFPEFPSDVRWLEVHVQVTNGEDTWWENVGFPVQDQRPALVWRWADWYMESPYGEPTFEPHYWERGETELHAWPGQEIGVQFAWREWNEEMGDTITVPLTEQELSDLTFEYENGNGFVSSSRFDNGCMLLYFHDFGECMAVLDNFAMRIVSELPDIGWYDDSIFDGQTGELIELTADSEAIWKNALQRNYVYDGSAESATFYLVAREPETVITQITECSRNNATFSVLPQNGARWVAVTLNGAPREDRLDVEISGRWNASDTFEYHHRDLQIYNSAPGLRVRFTDFDGDIPYIGYEWGEGYESWIEAAPGEDRIVEVYLYWEDSDHYPEWDVINPADITVTGPAYLEIDDRNEDYEYGFLRVCFTDFGTVTLHYVDPADGTEYTMVCDSVLPQLGFYSSPTNPSEETYLSEWNYDGTNDTIYLVGLNGVEIYEVENQCGSSLDITVAPNHKYAAIQLTYLWDDWLNVAVSGDWGGGNLFDGHFRGLHVNNVAPGMYFRWVDREWEGGYEDPETGEWIDGHDVFFERVEDELQYQFGSAPGDEPVLALYMRTYDADGEEVLTAIDPADVNVTGPAVVEIVDGEDGGEYLFIHVTGFGVITLAYGDYSIAIPSELPDIGFYSMDLLDEDGNLPENKQAWMDAYLTEWDFSYAEGKDCILLVARNDAVIESAEPDFVGPMWIEQSEDNEKVWFIGMEELEGDWLNVRMSGYWNEYDENSYFENYNHGIRVNDCREGLFFYYASSGWNEQTDEEEWFVSENSFAECYMSSDPDSRFVVQFFYRDEDGEVTILSAEDLIVESDSDFFTVSDVTDGIVEVYLLSWGEGTIGYSDWVVPVSCELPEAGWYDEGIFSAEGGLIPLEEMQAWQNAYLNRWYYDGENNTVYFALRNPWMRIYEAECMDGTAADVEISQDGTYVAVTVEDLTDEYLAMEFEIGSVETDDFGTPLEQYYHYCRLDIMDLRWGFDSHLSAHAYNDEDMILVPYGGQAVLAVEVDYDPFMNDFADFAVSYEWFRLGAPSLEEQDWVLLEGEESDTLTIGSVTEACDYVCVVRDSYDGCVEVRFRVGVENGLFVTRVNEPWILLEPGETVMLEVTAGADDMTDLRYQWCLEDAYGELEPIENATGTTLTVGRSGRYQCFAIDRYGNIASDYIDVTVDSGIEVTTVTPMRNFIHAGDDITLQLSASVTAGNVHFQWYWVNEDGNGVPIEGATTDTLVLEDVKETCIYYCEVQDDYNYHWYVNYTVTVVDGLILEASSQLELISALNRTEPVSAVYVTDSFTITDDCCMYFDEDHIEYYGDATMVIMPGVTLTLNDGGTIGCEWFSYDWDTMHDEYPEPNGSLYSYGTIIVNNGGAAVGGFTSVDGDVIVNAGGEFVMPERVNVRASITVNAGGALRTTQGGDSTIYGDVWIKEGAEMEARFGSTICNEYDGLRIDGDFYVGCAYYDGGTHVWFDNHGQVSGNGRIILRQIGYADMDGAIEWVMAMLGQMRRFDNWDDVGIYRELYVTTAEDLAAAFPGNRVVMGEEVEGDMDTIVRIEDQETGEFVELTIDDEIRTMGRIIIPENATVIIEDGGYLEAGIENYGVILVEAGGTLSTTMGGSIENYGSILVEEGGVLVSTMGGEVVNVGEGSVLDLFGTFNCGCVRYDNVDHVWFVNNGDVFGEGTIVLYNAGDAPLGDMNALIAAVEAAIEGDNTVTVTADVQAPAITITTQPVDYVGPEGSTATFTVVAEGEGLTYQWYIKNPGASEFSLSTKTEAVYTTPLRTTSSGRELYCVITDANGNTVTTNTVTMTIGIPVEDIVIVRQPVDAVVAADGDYATFTVIATGADLTYQWYIKNPGASEFSLSTKTEAVYTTPVRAATSGRELYCVITDAHGNTVTTNTVTMRIGAPAPAIVITSQPVDVVVAADGDYATFTVAATGEGLTYQWYIKNPGASEFSLSTKTEAVYTTPVRAATSGRELYCVITDANGNTITTNTVTMRIGAPAEPIVITRQPVDVVVAADGDYATFTVVAEGEGLSYQWYIKNPGASEFSLSTKTESVYTTPVRAATSGRELYCVITDAHGNTITTNTVTMTIGAPAEPIVITSQPVDVVVAADGDYATFTVAATGEGLTYQWYIKNPGASEFSLSTKTESVYTTPVRAATSGRELYCVITDANGNTVTTNTVTMRIGAPAEPIVITRQPVDVVVAADGDYATFTVVAEGEGLSYQWYIKNPGASEFSLSTKTEAVYTTPVRAATSGRELYCVITDANGNTVTTNTVTMRIGAPAEPIVITRQPVDVVVAADGDYATFTVAATGEGLTYQWYIKNPGASEFSLSTKTEAVYTTPVRAATSGRELYCVITDANGNTVTTNTVTMRIG